MTRALVASFCMVLAGLSLVIAAIYFSPAAIGQSSSAKPDPSPSREAQLQPPAQPTLASSALAVPPPEILLVMIRTTLVALNQAVHTGNFTVLRDLGAPDFQAANSPAQLGMIFADLRNRNIDLSPVVAVTPAVSEPPSITKDNMLKLAGYFPTSPLQIRFQILFQPVNGQWRLYGMAVDTPPSPQAAASETTNSVPAAPEAKPAAAPKPPSPAKKAVP